MGKEFRKTWLIDFVEDKRYAAMTGLGFSSGLPFLLVYSTQSAWLSEAGVPIETIGLLSELPSTAGASPRHHPASNRS
jgi:PAT family beta-lactamase induction signal transducer AmpG